MRATVSKKRFVIRGSGVRDLGSVGRFHYELVNGAGTEYGRPVIGVTCADGAKKFSALDAGYL